MMASDSRTYAGIDQVVLAKRLASSKCLANG